MSSVPVLWIAPDQPFERLGRVTAKGPLRRHDQAAYKQEFLRSKLAELGFQMGGDAIMDVTLNTRGWMRKRRIEARATVIRYAG